MTTSSATSPVTRETTAYVRDRGLRPVIVTISHGLIELRCKGLKSREVVDITSIYSRAVKERVIAERAAKKAVRKSRSRSKR